MNNPQTAKERLLAQARLDYQPERYLALHFPRDAKSFHLQLRVFDSANKKARSSSGPNPYPLEERVETSMKKSD